MSRRIRSGLPVAALVALVAGCASPAAVIVTEPLDKAEVDAAFSQAKVLGSESWMGDAATILDRHTIMMTIYTAADCPVNEVSVTEPHAGHLTVEVASATDGCDGDMESSSWIVKSEGDLIADGEPYPVEVIKGNEKTDVPVGGDRLDSFNHIANAGRAELRSSLVPEAPR